jgi:hypothetical protein
MAKPPLGSGARFKAIEANASGADDAAAVAAVAGRKAHGQKAMTRYSQIGKRRAARSRSGGR